MNGSCTVYIVYSIQMRKWLVCESLRVWKKAQYRVILVWLSLDGNALKLLRFDSLDIPTHPTKTPSSHLNNARSPSKTPKRKKEKRQAKKK